MKRALVALCLSAAACKEKPVAAQTPVAPPVAPAVPVAVQLTKAAELVRLPDGPFVLKRGDDSVQVEGAFKGGKRDGVWRSFYGPAKPGDAAVKAVEVRYANGHRDGELETWLPRGASWLRGRCSAGKCGVNGELSEVLAFLGEPDAARPDAGVVRAGGDIVSARGKTLATLRDDTVVLSGTFDDDEKVTVKLPAAARAGAETRRGVAVVTAEHELVLVVSEAVAGRYPLPPALRCDGDVALTSDPVNDVVWLGCGDATTATRVSLPALTGLTLDGLALWRAKTGDHVSKGDAVDGFAVTRVFESPSRGWVVSGRDVHTGEELWRNERSGDHAAAGDWVAISDDGLNLALRHRVTGHTQWVHALPAKGFNVVLTGDGAFAMFSNGGDTFVRKVDVATGDERFTVALGSKPHDSGTTVKRPMLRERGGVLLASGLTVVSGPGRAVALSAADGKRLGAADADAAAVEAGTLYFTEGGTLKGVKLEGGAETMSVALTTKPGWSCFDVHVSGKDVHALCLPPGEVPSGGKTPTAHAVSIAKATHRALGPACGCDRDGWVQLEGGGGYQHLGDDVGVELVSWGSELLGLPRPLPKLK
ncbi:MAG: hypothetical protein JNK82_14115 [Myxococcaceae bacterium]|nr:hypothetical protein [Myxococcaceae bacterium]